MTSSFLQEALSDRLNLGTFRCVGDGQAALLEIETPKQREFPDIVILDFQMMIKFDIRFMKKKGVRNPWLDIPVVIWLDGPYAENIALQCARAGAITFLAKPVTFDEYLQFLDDIAHRREQALSQRTIHTWEISQN